MANYLIGIDEGTTGCKTCIFDEAGNLISMAYREYPCYYPNPGWVEQKSDDIIPMLFESCKEAVTKADLDPTQIRGVSFSTQGSCMVLLDENGEPVRDFIGWQDTRSIKEREEIFARKPAEHIYQISGGNQITMPTSRYLWLQKHEPENWSRIKRIASSMDYALVAFGADDYWADASSCSRLGIFDVDKYEWSQELIDFLDMGHLEFPKVAKLGQVVGYVKEDISQKTGLPIGLPIMAGAMDCCCSAFGVGSYKDGEAAMVVGTYGSIFVNSDNEVRDPNCSLMVKPYVPTQRWTIEGSSSCAASSYRWFRDIFCGLEKAAASEIGISAYDLINKEIESVEPGANGVTYLSYLQGADGVRANANCKGGFAGLTIGTSKAEIGRAVMEGICYELKVVLDYQLSLGVQLSGIRLAGGAARSPMWCQMFADIFQTDIIVTEAEEAGCLGAALIGGIGIGVYKDAEDASRKACRILHEYKPDPTKKDAYEEAYARYNRLYDAMSQGYYID